MRICTLCDTNPAQDCKRCGRGLSVCADCVAADEWLRCSVCRVMSRRNALKLAGAVGYMLVAGYVGDIPRHVIDSIGIRQNASEPKRHRVDAGTIHHSWHVSVATVSIKRAPTT